MILRLRAVGLALVDAAHQDLRHALRMLRRQPGLTIAVALTLGAGIGVTTAIFSLVHAVLLRPFPYPEPERLVRVYSGRVGSPAQRGGLSVLDLEAMRERAGAFSTVAGCVMFDTNLAGDRPGEAVKIAWVTPGLFEVTGVAPILGRSFVPDDDRLGGDNNKVVLGYHVWRNHFGGDPAIVGKQVRIRLMSYTIVGVMPAGYRYPSRADVWAPLQSWLNKFDEPHRLQWSWRATNAIARLAPGMTVEEAEVRLRTLGAQIEREEPQSNRDLTYAVLPLRTAEVGELRPYLLLLSVGVGCVLLIACANIASLLLAQAMARSREFVLRAAIGAGRGRVVCQLLTESLVLAAIGGVLGLAFALAGTRALAALLPVDRPAWIAIDVSWPVLMFGLAATGITGLLVGLAPALEATRQDLHGALRQGTGGSAPTGRLRKVLVASEVALSMVLLVVSGLMLKAFLLLYTSEPGFDPRNLLTAFISPHRVGTDEELTHAYWQIYSRTLEKLSSTPGIVAAAGATTLPYAFDDSERPRGRLTVRRGSDGEPARIPAWTSTVSPGYFGAMGIPMFEGRDFTEADTYERECVAIISRRAADRVWKGAPALGDSAQFGWGGGSAPWCRVIGIVGNVRYRGSDDDQGIEVYFSYRQREAGSFYFVAKTRGSPMQFGGAIRSAVTAGDRETGVIAMSSMEALMGESLWRRRLWGVLLGAYALLALVLAAVGLYGVLAHTVRRRTREVGIRVALGAGRWDTIALVCREAAVLVGIGGAIGLVAAALAARAMAAMLYRVPPHDLSVFVATPLVLAIVAAVACALPARRAASIDPAVALRNDQ